MAKQSRDQDKLPVIRATYEFLTWLVPKVGKFSHDLRVHASRADRAALLLVLKILIRAKYSKSKRDLLDAANVELEILRFLLQLSHDLKALLNKDYDHTAKCVTDNGQQVGGSARERSKCS